MKKLVLFAAAFAALVACNKEAAVSTDSFVKGQKVTLNISAPSTTKVTSELNGDAVDFKWEANDVIKVTVNGEPATFTLKSGAGESSATFEGEMPGSGSSFEVQYPYGAPDITSQTYSASEAIPHNMMLFTKTNCSLDTPFALEGQNALLRLNLWSTDAKTISKIDVKNTASGTITLNIDGGKTLPTAKADSMAFFIVVPAGDYTFTAEIYDNAATPASICSFTPSAAQSFNNGEILNMPAKEVKKAGPVYTAVDLGLSVKWATFNVGAAKPEEYGTYFAYGDVDGQTWDVTKEEWSDGGFSDFFNYELDAKGNLLPAYDAAQVNWGGSWRMPTNGEQDELINNCTTGWTDNYEDTGIAGTFFTSDINGNTIFLPAAGRGDFSYLYDAGSYGYYWSSTFDTAYFARNLYFDGALVNTLSNYCSYGLPVRPVCP